MVDVGYQKPSNAILVAGHPLVQYLKVEDATNMYAGRLVKQGTNDDDVSVADVWALNSMAVGWLGYEHTDKKHRPATVDTIYLVDSQAAVLNGGGFVIVAALQASQGTLKKGDALVMGTNGCVKKASAVVGTIPTGTTQVLSHSATLQTLTMTGGIEADGPIVAYAEETIADVAAITDIMVRSVI
jgi:hypothetical protein